MIFVFDAIGAVKTLSLEFRHHPFGLTDTGAPRHVVGVAIFLVQVFEMKTKDVALEFLEALDRIQTRACPMTGISARPQQWTAAFDRIQDRLRVPVVRRFGM